MKQMNKNYKLMFVSLGCDKNLVDTEKMLSILNGDGFTFTDDEYDADIIVVNTCCFINDAKEESIQTLLEMAKRKEDAKCSVLIAAGCLAQRYKEEITREIPEVDGMVGTTAYDKIAEVITECLDSKGLERHFSDFEDVNRMPQQSKRIVTTGGYYAHLKIAEGCNKHCTYCIIPKVRGDFRSVPMDELILEAQQLAESGVKELILVAQETTMYGIDLYGKKMLHVLLQKLAQISGIVWIRILYCYPEEIYPELIQVMKEEKKVCHYLDMPIQHASDRILKRMGRKTSREELEKTIQLLRKEIPDITLRTTLIAGFPGETEEDYEELYHFVNEMEFDRLGVFTYSPEENTPAAEFKEQILEEVKQNRRDELMELQQEIAFEKSESMIGKTLYVMVEGKIADENAYVARTYMDAPGIDGNIFITTDEELISGDFVLVKVTGACEYDLIGEIIK